MTELTGDRLLRLKPKRRPRIDPHPERAKHVREPKTADIEYEDWRHYSVLDIYGPQDRP